MIKIKERINSCYTEAAIDLNLGTNNNEKGKKNICIIWIGISIFKNENNNNNNKGKNKIWMNISILNIELLKLIKETLFNPSLSKEWHEEQHKQISHLRFQLE